MDKYKFIKVYTTGSVIERVTKYLTRVKNNILAGLKKIVSVFIRHHKMSLLSIIFVILFSLLFVDFPDNTVRYYKSSPVVEKIACVSESCHVRLLDETTMVTTQPVSIGTMLVYRLCTDKGNRGNKVSCNNASIILTSYAMDGRIPYTEYIKNRRDKQ